jgi:uncharacterized membrane protein
MGEIGPVQMVAFGFAPDAKFEGKIMAELANLEEQGTVRILDLLFVQKDADSGDLIALEHQGEDLGAIVGALLGFEFEGDGADAPASPDIDACAFGLSQGQIEGLGESLEPGSAAAFLLIEHVWARDLKRAIRDTGGVPLGEGFLTPEVIGAVAPELAAMAEALDEVQAEQAS